MRYSHKYAVIADLDEFFHIAKRAQVVSISALMDKYLPQSAAGLAFMDIHFPRDCPTGNMGFDKEMMPVTWTGLFSDQYTLQFRTQTPEGHEEAYYAAEKALDFQVFKSKSIVRVADCFSVNAHGPEILKASDKQQTWFLPHFLAYYKHIRYQGPTACLFGPKAWQEYLFHKDAVLYWMEP